MGATSGAGTAYSSGAHEFTQVLSGVRITQSLVLCICFVDHCLSFCTFYFGHCVVCSSSIYGFRLPSYNLEHCLFTGPMQRRNNKYQFHSLRFGSTGTQSNPRSTSRQPLQHRCNFKVLKAQYDAIKTQILNLVLTICFLINFHQILSNPKYLKTK